MGRIELSQVLFFLVAGAFAVTAHPPPRRIEAEVDPITRTPSWRVPLSELAGEDVFDGIDEEEKDVYAGVSA